MQGFVIGGEEEVSCARLLRLTLAAFVLLLCACGRSEGVEGKGSQVVVKVLSNRADLISAGDVLIEVVTPAGADTHGLDVRVGRRDVSGAFGRTADGRILGLVEGLAPGSNRITARLGGASGSATVVNHPNGGPVIAGPQLQPWTCLNPGAVDAQCNQPPEYSYLYKSTNPAGVALQTYDPENPPADVATTTTDHGVAVPYIVRVETGYQDRDQYRIAVLFRPDQPWTAVAPQPQFNRKLLVTHGGNCGVEYQSGEAPSVVPGPTVTLPGTTAGVAQDAVDEALGRGYAVMSTSLNNSGHNCNIAIQAESLIMAKERLIEQYGELRYTIGQGCSGGSLTVQWIANAYPGIYQGILPACSFTDTWSTATQFMDYHLLLSYFNNPGKWGTGVAWSPTQMADVEGHLTPVNAVVSETAQFHVLIPTDPCTGISDVQRYHPQTNPGGVRCAIQDAAINVLGPRTPQEWSENEKGLGRGFAALPLDNLGVQYGLQALQQGSILPEQFLDLNEKIGGLDIDINLVPGRTSAGATGLANAYRSGSINTASNLDRTAIIDCRGPDPGIFHDAQRAFAMRARLDREHGGHDNQLIWQGPVPLFADTACAQNAFIAMDRWLSAIEQDQSSQPLARKVVTAKPSDLGDACYSGAGVKLADGLCGSAVVPVYATPPDGRR